MRQMIMARGSRCLARKPGGNMEMDDLDRAVLRALDPASVDGLSKAQRDAVAEAIMGAWRRPHPCRACDEVGFTLGLRFGRDTRYGSSTVAGAGPLLASTLRHREGADIVGVSLGLDVWGAN